MSEKKKVFISGPISSRLESYKSEFEAAAKLVEGAGFLPILPSTLPIGMDPGDYMRITLAMLETSDMVLLLDGWEDSDGAQLEVGYADYIKKPCVTVPDFKAAYLTQAVPAAKPVSRVERTFGPRESWNTATPKSADAPEQTHHGYKGFLLVRCRNCGEIRGFCAKDCIADTECRNCGEVTPLEDLIPAYVNCEKCGARFKYRTNIIDQKPVEYECLECKAPVDLQLNAKGTALVTIRERSGGGTDNDHHFGKAPSYWMQR